MPDPWDSCSSSPGLFLARFQQYLCSPPHICPFTSHMPIAESQPKLPNPKLPMENSKTAGLMIRKEKTQMSPQLTMVA